MRIRSAPIRFCGRPYDPFLSDAFLYALEQSESVCPQTGWAPYHVALEDEEAGALGVAPMYLKSHSQGEYVFDHAWADAFERASGEYGPQVTGRRALHARDGSAHPDPATRASGGSPKPG
ncbi:MAG: peptidogalycan biosysnthesis protein [Gammaproteobacteria bacterium]|nr:peptidogalycan biosysnthesis protein [Gammaproteobacteria bacterium]